MTQPDDDLERTVTLLRRTLEQHVTPDVRARHLGSVQRKAAQMRLDQRRSLRAARRPRVALLAALVGAMLVGTSSAALAASGGSVPGDVLYPVKRGGEEVRLLVATPFSAQGGVQLDIATERVHEAYQVAETHPDQVVPLIEEAGVAIAAAEAVGQPLVGAAEEALAVQAEAALALANVAVAALPADSGLSQEIALVAAATESTTALSDDPTRSGTLPGAAPAAGDPTGDPDAVLPETVTVSPSPLASPTASPSSSPVPSPSATASDS